MSKKSKIIAVWGNNGSGKSMLSCAVANKLTSKGNVIVISLDKVAPMFRTYLPTVADDPSFSIGKLQGELITLSALKNKIHTHPSNGNLGFMSYVQGDSVLTYQGNWKMETLQRLVDILLQHELASYIVFDCTSDILDSSTLFALESAAVVISVSSPDCRSLSFAASAEPVANGSNLRLEHQLLVLNNVYEYSPTAQMVKDWGFRYVLPHSDSAYKRLVGGQLVHKLEGYEGYAFEKTLDEIVQKVVSMTNEQP